MNRMRRIAGMGKSKKAPSAVQKDKDESIVFFRELYKHEKDTDVNLLEPIYSVEFDAIQGGHMSKPPPGKRDLFMPINEKHDYDWPKTLPVAPMFPSLKMEAGSSETVVSPKELPIPIAQPVKPSASKLVGKTEATKTSAKAPAGSSSSNYGKRQPCTTDRRPASAYASTLPNRQQKPDAKASSGASSNSRKAHSHMYYANAGQDSSSSSARTADAVETPGEAPYTAPKNLLTTGSVFARRRVSTTAARARPRGPPLGVDAKVESGKARRPPCPPAAAAKELQVDGRKNALPAKGKAVAGTGGEPTGGGRAGTSKTSPAKGMRRTEGKNERRPRFADQ